MQWLHGMWILYDTYNNDMQIQRGQNSNIEPQKKLSGKEEKAEKKNSKARQCNLT